MSKRKTKATTPRKTRETSARGRSKKASSRSGTPWPKSRADAPWPKSRADATPDALAVAEAALGPVERETLAVFRELRVRLSRDPSPAEVAELLGVRDARPRLATLERLGLITPLMRLSRPQMLCLTAIATLQERLGRSPSTREVSREMGLSPSASRFHINNLVALGLLNPPEVVTLLSVTPAGRAYLPRAPLPHGDGTGNDGGPRDNGGLTGRATPPGGGQR